MIPQALLLGDSQTQLGWADSGWVSQLSDKFVRRLELINRGLSGYNTRMLLTVLPDILKHEDLKRVRVVTLMMGSNDASFPDKNPEQAVSLEEFGENMLKIITMLLCITDSLHAGQNISLCRRVELGIKTQTPRS